MGLSVFNRPQVLAVLVSSALLLFAFQNCGNPKAFEDADGQIGLGSTDPAVIFRLHAPPSVIVNENFELKVSADEAVDAVTWHRVVLQDGRPSYSKVGEGLNAEMSFANVGVRQMMVEVSRGNWSEKRFFPLMVVEAPNQVCPASLEAEDLNIHGLAQLEMPSAGVAKGFYAVAPQHVYSTVDPQVLCFSVERVEFSRSPDALNSQNSQPTASGNPTEISFDSIGQYNLGARVLVRNQESNQDFERNLASYRVDVVADGQSQCPNPNIRVSGSAVAHRGVENIYSLSADCYPKPVEQVTWYVRDDKGNETVLSTTTRRELSISTRFSGLSLGNYSMHAVVKYAEAADYVVEAGSLAFELKESPIYCLAVVPEVRIEEVRAGAPASSGVKAFQARFISNGCIRTEHLDSVWLVNDVPVLDTPGVYTDYFATRFKPGKHKVKIVLYAKRGAGQTVPPCIFNPKDPCKPWAPKVLFEDEIVVSVDEEQPGPSEGYHWAAANCLGQCIKKPWWRVSLNGYICLNGNVQHSPPDNPYDPSLCGPVPTERPPENVHCPAVCSPWGGGSLEVK